MPCWMNITSGLEIRRPDMTTLRATAQSLGAFKIHEGPEAAEYDVDWAADFSVDGIRFSITVKNGNLSIGGPKHVPPEMVRRVCRAYSAEIVKSQAKRFGWQLKQTGPNKFQLQK